MRWITSRNPFLYEKGPLKSRNPLMVWPFIHACHLLKSVNGHLSYNKQRLQQKDLAFVVPQRCLLSTVGGSHHISFSHTTYVVFLTHETTSTSESQSATQHPLCNDLEIQIIMKFLPKVGLPSYFCVDLLYTTNSYPVAF